MFVRNLDDVKSAGRVLSLVNDTTRSARFLTAADGMGFSYHMNWVGAGSVANLWYKHHWEANYIISGKGKLTDKTTGETWEFGPGTLYNVGPNDSHIFECTTDEHHCSVFCPALTGKEVHDSDGAYSPSGEIPKTDRRMFVLRADELRKAGREITAANGQAKTIRMLTAADKMGFSFSDVHFAKGAVANLWYKNHWESNHILSGSGTVEDLTSGETWPLEPGMIYCVGPKDRHRVTAKTDIHLLSVFCPPLNGDEQHDADGALGATGPVPPGPPGY